ncbi:hypothetical protein ACE1CI_32885 [Aerosakkonemataceae cyanobacterium BLCC-F50]|uniref:Uncharacterized protein n=1 Tax=Floridaenema flaviceps BLCC-F50 TaxID=3153642 RepID=A0ABV4Y2Q5_9CYAN
MLQWYHHQNDHQLPRARTSHCHLLALMPLRGMGLMFFWILVMQEIIDRLNPPYVDTNFVASAEMLGVFFKLLLDRQT